jgi:hypothetical protein
MMALSFIVTDVWLTSPRLRGEGEVFLPLQARLIML